MSGNIPIPRKSLLRLPPLAAPAALVVLVVLLAALVAPAVLVALVVLVVLPAALVALVVLVVLHPVVLAVLHPVALHPVALVDPVVPEDPVAERTLLPLTPTPGMTCSTSRATTTA